MSIAQRGAATGQGAALSTSIACPVPAGVLPGDLLLWHIAQAIATAPTADPTGWSRLQFATTTNDGSWSWYRIADGTEGSSVTSPTLTSAQTATSMVAYSGVDPVTPFDVTMPAASVGTTTIPFPAISPVSAGAMMIALSAVEYAAAAAFGTISSSNMSLLVTTPSTGISSSIHVISSIAAQQWFGSAFTPAMASSNAPTRTIGQALALRPLNARPSIRVPNGEAVQRASRW